MNSANGDGLTTPSGTAPAGGPAKKKPSRLPLIDALRAIAATLIAWHHLALYPPLSDQAMPVAGMLIDLLRSSARVAQVFFVVSGYILAQSMLPKAWDARGAGRFLMQRYCRLGLPYLGAIAAALAAWAFARNWLAPPNIDPPPTWPQLVAHLFFLQDILGYGGVSAGLWFVCISMQLSVLFVAGLYTRDAIAGRDGGQVRRVLSQLPMLAGWLLAAASLFYFNRNEALDAWAVYFFGQFFLGVVIYVSLTKSKLEFWFYVYIVMMLAAVAVEFRARLLTAIATGVVLFVGGKLGFISTWPQNRGVSFMGRTSYSLFLIHYPVLLIVAGVWAMLGWTTPSMAAAGLVLTYLLSIAAAAVFYRFVESPAAKLSNRFR